ncbi:Unannotated [Lentimonas sp. CC6]|nr:Unannotated [Lentimonas sp. CC6]
MMRVNITPEYMATRLQPRVPLAMSVEPLKELDYTFQKS